jgi:hypothetical protein
MDKFFVNWFFFDLGIINAQKSVCEGTADVGDIVIWVMDENGFEKKCFFDFTNICVIERQREFELEGDFSVSSCIYESVHSKKEDFS